MLNHLKQKILIISIPIQNQWKVPWRDLDKQMGGHQTQAVSFHSSRSGKLVLLFSDAETCSFRDVYKVDFKMIMISVNVHVTFKSGKIIAIFHIDPTHTKFVAEKHPLG